MKELESEAWEDFLDMTISQALLWAATNVQPEQKSSEIAPSEPLLYRFALRRFRRLGQRSRGSADCRDQVSVLLGLREHVDRAGPVLRGRRFRRFQPQVLLRLAR